jgi:Fe2+ or Zn2+ uptake regulation protein
MQPAATAPSPRRQTRQRDAVLRAVRQIGGHADVRTVYDEVRRELPGISLATVYRNLDVLTRQGLINAVRPGQSGQVHYDNNVTHHGHLTCRKCGRIEDIEIASLEARARREFKASGFINLSLDVDIHGLCPACAEHEPVPPR